MIFRGISKVFSTRNNEQYTTIGEFWDEMSRLYDRENLMGLGYNWTENSIEYVIGLKNGTIENANCNILLPEKGWNIIKGHTDDLESIYNKIYVNGLLKYELEMFFDNGECEIWYYR